MKPTRKEITDEFWFRGNLNYKLHAGQRVIKEQLDKQQNQLFVGNIARQFGKSFLMVCKAIETALKYPNSQIRYGTAFHSDLVQFIIPAFTKVMEDCPSSLKVNYLKQGSKYEFNNGSVIKLVGLDKNPNSLRGNTLDLVIIDECGFVTNLDYIYKSVLIPATTHRPNCKIIMISTPPSTPAHPFLDYIQKAELENSYIKLTIYDNPMIDDGTIERLKNESGGENSTTWRREYLCETIVDSDLAIIPEWKDEFVQDLPRDQYYLYYHKYVGLDLGVKDNTACIFGYYDFKRASLVIEDEFTMSGPSMNTELLVAKIREYEKNLWGQGDNKELPPSIPYRRIADNNWPIMMQDFSSIHNLTFIATNKDSLEAMINEVRIMVQYGQIIIKPNCEHLIGCLKYGVWDRSKKGFARSAVYGHFDHLAALIYLVRNLAKHTNPIPSSHGKENHNAWLYHVNRNNNKTNNARVMANALLPKRKV